ncbi:MAG: hypothetical protein AAF441_05310 [Pseudomonadota bacterium]
MHKAAFGAPHTKHYLAGRQTQGHGQSHTRGPMPGSFAAKGKTGTCPAHAHGASGGSKGAKASVESLQLAVGRLEKMIAQFTSGKSHSCGPTAHGKGKSVEQQITDLLKTLSASVSGQAKGDAPCAAAGQMGELVNKLEATLQSGVQPDYRHSAGSPDQAEVKEMLTEISALLKRLNASLHSGLPVQRGH